MSLRVGGLAPILPPVHGALIRKTVFSPKNLSYYYLCIYDTSGAVVHDYLRDFGGIPGDIFHIDLPEQHLVSNLWFGFRGHGRLHPENPDDSQDHELITYQCPAHEIPDSISQDLFTIPD